MQTFIYDDSFEGLLTCIFEAYRLRLMPNIVAQSEHLEQLFDTAQTITTDSLKAERVSKKLRTLSPDIFATVQCCYLSAEPNKGNLCFKYIQQALYLGKKVDYNYAEPAVSQALACRRAVTFEAHRFKGLLRFQELKDGSWYAACAPDHCILPLLAPHCQNRFSKQDWIIHDTKRDLAMVQLQGQLQLFTHTELVDIQAQLSAQEKTIRNYGKLFSKISPLPNGSTPHYNANLCLKNTGNT